MLANFNLYIAWINIQSFLIRDILKVIQEENLVVRFSRRRECLPIRGVCLPIVLEGGRAGGGTCVGGTEVFF